MPSRRIAIVKNVIFNANIKVFRHLTQYLQVSMIRISVQTVTPPAHHVLTDCPVVSVILMVSSLSLAKSGKLIMSSATRTELRFPPRNVQKDISIQH